MKAFDYQPQLSMWSHIWRYALMLAISAAAWTQAAIWQWDHERWWFWTDLSVGLLGFVVVAWRRALPVSVAVGLNVLASVSFAMAGPATLALVSLATRRRWREVIPVGVVSLIAGLVIEVNNPVTAEPLAFTIPFIVAIVAVTVGWGMYIGSRRELLATLRERAHVSEAAQAARVAQARTAERAQIAREMHDVLAHRISLVTMHAGALTYRKDLDADQMRATAEVIQENSHQAMVELREVLGLLRDGPGDSAPELPQPSACDLPALLEEARNAGMHVESDLIELDGIPETLGRTVYRVIQEGLTNARKHGPNTLVRVSVAGNPGDGLTASVRNPLPIGSRTVTKPESGLGLIGLSERAALAGGLLTHEVTAGPEFVLTVWIPWPT